MLLPHKTFELILKKELEKFHQTARNRVGTLKSRGIKINMISQLINGTFQLATAIHNDIRMCRIIKIMMTVIVHILS